MGKSELQMVATGKLKVDQNYQRDLNERRVARMAETWDDDLAGALHVAARNGSWYVADGQHRLAAARAAGVRELPAIVHFGLTPADEAALFERVNTLTVKPGVADIFRARLEAGDEIARTVMDVTQKLGVSIQLRSGGKDNRVGVCRSVGTLQQIVRFGGASMLGRVLSAAIEAWPDDPMQLTAIPLAGIGAFIYTYGAHPQYEYRRIAAKLGERSVRTFLQRATFLSEGSFMTGGTGSVGGVPFNRAGPRRAVLEAYNRHLRNPLPDASAGDYRRLRGGDNPWL